MEELKKYKLFIAGTIFFALLILWINFGMGEEEANKIELQKGQKYTETGTKDKATQLTEAYQDDWNQNENKQKFLSAAEKMIGIIEFQQDDPAPEKINGTKNNYISENTVAIDRPVVLETQSTLKKEEKTKLMTTKNKSLPKTEEIKEIKTEEKAVNENDYWVSVGERKAARSKKSAKVGYKSAHIETLGEKIKDGDKISIVIDEAIQIGDEIFPEDSELFGTISFQKKRGIIKISRIIKGSNAMSCNIDAYDMDGYLGIALDIDIEQEIASDGVDEGINQAASYGGNASRIAASLVSGAAKKIKADPYVKIENKRKIYLSVN